MSPEPSVDPASVADLPFTSAPMREQYELLTTFCDELPHPDSPIVGRTKEIGQVLAAMLKPSMPNVLLLAPAGSGKSALVEGCNVVDASRRYLTVNVPLLAKNREAMGANIQALFAEAELYTGTTGHELVMFMDEVHLIQQASEEGAQAIKPVLARSGSHGLHIIAATTRDEFHKYMAEDLALVERFQRIDLEEPDRKTTIEILKNYAAAQGFAEHITDNNVYDLIYEYTNRFEPASNQPRKSLKALESMEGERRYHDQILHQPCLMDRALLSRVIETTTGVNTAFQVDATAIEASLNKNVFDQARATNMVARKLQSSVADLNNKDRPQGSFLFLGPTGSGKQCANNTPVPVIPQVPGDPFWKKHGDLRVGDVVADRNGAPTRVIGIFPNRDVDMYRFTLADGRSIDVGGPHLWPVFTAKMRKMVKAGQKREDDWRVMSTEELAEIEITKVHADGRREHRYFIPANGAVEWPEQDFPLDPYVVGALLANGCLTSSALHLSSDDFETVERVRVALGSPEAVPPSSSYSWAFRLPEGTTHRGRKNFQTADVIEPAGMQMVKSPERSIPVQYLHGSVEQRWALVQGLFDCDGTITTTGGRFNVSYSTFSPQLAEDVRTLLLSLGIVSSISESTRFRQDDEDAEPRRMTEYHVHVKVGNDDKWRFFRLSRKLETAHRAMVETTGRQRVKDFSMVAIDSIEYIGKQDASCILVDNDEHLYQAGEFIVTHNTELSKQLARLLFGDAQNHFLRFDMAEYALAESLPEFQHAMAKAMSDFPFSVLLIDEIEKAHGTIIKLLLSVVDDGRLTDENGRPVSFKNAYLIATSNVAAQVFEKIGRRDSNENIGAQGNVDYMEKYMPQVRNALDHYQDGKFPPEFLGRFDAVVPFNPLDESTNMRIASRHLNRLRTRVRTVHSVDLVIDRRVAEFIVKEKSENSANAGGARKVLHDIDTYITDEVASYLNEHAHDARRPATLVLNVAGRMRHEQTVNRYTGARVVVYDPAQGAPPELVETLRLLGTMK